MTVGASRVDSGRLHVLSVGRLTEAEGVRLLAAAFLRARRHDPRLHLVLAGGGPEAWALRRELGDAATFLGRGEELADAYASADLFLLCSPTVASAPAIRAAQASGLPVVAVAAGAATELIEDGRSGCLVPPDAGQIAETIVRLGRSRPARDRLRRGGLAAVAERAGEASPERLAGAYRTVLEPAATRGKEATRVA